MHPCVRSKTRFMPICSDAAGIDDHHHAARHYSEASTFHARSNYSWLVQRRAPMESTTQTPNPTVRPNDAMNELSPFSSGAMLGVSRLMLDGSPLPDVLAVIAQLAESRGDDAQCSIWLPEHDGKQVYCAAAPSMPSFREQVGPFRIGPGGGPPARQFSSKRPFMWTTYSTTRTGAALWI